MAGLQWKATTPGGQPDQCEQIELRGPPAENAEDVRWSFCICVIARLGEAVEQVSPLFDMLEQGEVLPQLAEPTVAPAEDGAMRVHRGVLTIAPRERTEQGSKDLPVVGRVRRP